MKRGRTVSTTKSDGSLHLLLNFIYQQQKNEVETRGHKQRGILGFPLIVLPPPSLALSLQFAADKGKKKEEKNESYSTPSRRDD